MMVVAVNQQQNTLYGTTKRGEWDCAGLTNAAQKRRIYMLNECMVHREKLISTKVRWDEPLGALHMQPPVPSNGSHVAGQNKER